MSFTINFNGNILPIKVLNVSGRGPTSYEARRIETSGPGSRFIRKRRREEFLGVTYDISASDLESLRISVDDLDEMITSNGPVPIIFSDEPTFTYYGMAADDQSWEESIFKGRGLLNIVRFDPYKYMAEITHDLDASNVINLTQPSALPIIEATFLDEVITQADFLGKVQGSIVENPHIARRGAFATLHDPINPTMVEFINDGEYANISVLNGATTSSGGPSSTTGNIGQQIFAFDLIAEFKNKYGYDVPGVGITDQVQWLKDNINRIDCNWWGKGVNPSGSKANLARYSVSALAWSDYDIANVIHTNSTSTLLQVSWDSSSAQYAVDSLGKAYFLVSAVDPSDGVSPSSVQTDYVELKLYIKNEASDFKITHQESGKDIRVIWNFIANDILTIDLTKRKILINGAAKMESYDISTSQPFELQKGDNTLIIEESIQWSNVKVKYKPRR